MKLSTPWKLVLVVWLEATASSQTMAADPAKFSLRGGGATASEVDATSLIAPTVVGVGVPTPAPRVIIFDQNQRMLGPGGPSNQNKNGSSNPNKNKNKNRPDDKASDDSIKINYGSQTNDQIGTKLTNDIEISGLDDNKKHQNNNNNNNNNNVMKYTDIPPPPPRLPQGGLQNGNQRNNYYRLNRGGQDYIPPPPNFPPPGGNNQRLQAPKTKLRRKKRHGNQETQQQGPPIKQQQNGPTKNDRNQKKKLKRKKTLKDLDMKNVDVDLRPGFVKLDHDYKKFQQELAQHRKANPPPKNLYQDENFQIMNREKDLLEAAGPKGLQYRNDYAIWKNSAPKKGATEQEKVKWEERKRKAVDHAARFSVDFLKLAQPQVAMTVMRATKKMLDDRVELAGGMENEDANVYVNVGNSKTLKEKANDVLPENMQLFKTEPLRYNDKGLDEKPYEDAEGNNNN